MPRTANDVGMPGANEKWPPAGQYVATCVKADYWVSPNKKTPAIMLFWETLEGDFSFSDPIFMTPKALRRLNLVAQRVCQMPEDFSLSDDDATATKEFGKFIMENAVGQTVNVNVEVVTEKFVYQTGPKAGQQGEKIRHRVPFSGYEEIEDATPSGMTQAAEEIDEEAKDIF